MLSIKNTGDKDGKNMAPILIVDNVSNIILAFLFVICLPQVEFHHSYIFIRFDGIVRYIINPTTKVIFLGLIFSAYVNIFSSVPMGYLQRSQIICRNYSKTKNQLIFAYVLTFSYSLITGFFYVSNFYLTVPDEIKMNVDIFSTIWYMEGNNVWDSLLVNNNILVFKIISGIVFMILVINVYSITPLQILKMFRLFKRHKNIMTAKSVKLQNQFQRIMYFHMVITIFVLLLPLIIIVISLHMKPFLTSGIGLWIVLTFYSIPFCMSFTTIFLTSNYRKVICCQKKMNNVFLTTEKIKVISQKKF
ncbi:7TM GPCR, serpentine receptor class h (Srh) family-containing protein [Strongyloides ratti]|uniref:7TM GPCR, serpentine receptor class h (Srh) family-containing protein n=1 Tax=Strongyloides ratti TaxID=34506 RepID=A0A090MWP7_STRRB|nr:7TM GPCR, serpentine receptor class h (Srh) family-containing protein [Strongyloides ratti]CEF64054.1 7TM GPCR, serpentine receptor class h (Srh) family-containing protein [Strongyloides ratti]